MNKANVKTFYSYELPENKSLLGGLKVTMIASIVIGIAGLVYILMNFKSMQNVVTGLAIIAIAVFVFINAYPAWQFFNKLFTNETIVSHNWGLETTNNGIVKNIKWEDIMAFDTQERKFCLVFKQTQYILTLKGQDKYYFYSSIENISFLENNIRKNIKNQLDELTNVNWIKKSN